MSTLCGIIMRHIPNPKTILITGASSGVGEALAMAYADKGITLLLLGRDSIRLTDIEVQCRMMGAMVQSACIDVREVDAMHEWILAQDALHPIELVIANAGISGGTLGLGENEEQARSIFDVNVTGVLNTIMPIIPRMQERKFGQIAIMSSLASFRALSGAPAYSASKAAVRFYGEALRGVLKPHNIAVNVICPGYIKTPMTAVNAFPMPFMMSAESAAEYIKHALSCGKRRIAFPKRLYFPLYFLSMLSPVLTDWFFDLLPSKSHKS